MDVVKNLNPWHTMCGLVYAAKIGFAHRFLIPIRASYPLFGEQQSVVHT